jgi:2'-5' RNA ligase
MRLFVGLSIPGDVRENLSSLIRTLRSADARPKWVRSENLHVTLKFIGEIESEKSLALGRALAAVRSTQLVHVEFRGVGFFPNQRRPSVLWAGVHGSPSLVSLAAEINSVLAPLGIPHEEKPFVPHLTIARFKELSLSPALRAAIERFSGHNFGSLSTADFYLIESKLKNTGAEYTTLRSFRFAAQSTESKES